MQKSTEINRVWLKVNGIIKGWTNWSYTFLSSSPSAQFYQQREIHFFQKHGFTEILQQVVCFDVIISKKSLL